MPEPDAANQVRGGLKVQTLVHNNHGLWAGAEKSQAEDRRVGAGPALHSLPPPPASPEDEGVCDIVSCLQWSHIVPLEETNNGLTANWEGMRKI